MKSLMITDVQSLSVVEETRSILITYLSKSDSVKILQVKLYHCITTGSTVLVKVWS